MWGSGAAVSPRTGFSIDHLTSHSMLSQDQHTRCSDSPVRAASHQRNLVEADPLVVAPICPELNLRGARCTSQAGWHRSVSRCRAAADEQPSSTVAQRCTPPHLVEVLDGVAAAALEAVRVVERLVCPFAGEEGQVPAVLVVECGRDWCVRPRQTKGTAGASMWRPPGGRANHCLTGNNTHARTR
jgi:hypothetical protein